VSEPRARGRRIEPVWAGVGLIVGMMASSIVAFTLTSNRCSGDGSFDPFAAPSRASWYCHALHPPTGASSFTATGLILCIAVFALPSVIVIIGTVWADRRDSYRPLVIPAIGSTMIVAATFALLPAAHVTYVPVA
jgi:hypothetical protein